MAITKRIFVDKIEVLEDGQLNIRTATQFFEGGEAVSEKSFHRKTIEVGDDVTAEDALVKDVVDGKLFTAARVAKAQARRGPP